MKKSLTKKVLVLSMAVLVVAASGCERQGRAPKKAAPGGGQQNIAAPAQPNAKPSATPDEALADPEKTASLTKMDCSAGIKDEAPTAATFGRDVSSMATFHSCIAKFGLELAFPKPDEKLDEKEFILSSKDEDIVGMKRSTLRDEFMKLAIAQNSNDDDARRALEDRLEILKSESKKMIEKYSGKLDPTTKLSPVSGNDEGSTLEGILVDLELIEELADKTTKELADLRSVSVDGADLSKAE